MAKLDVPRFYAVVTGSTAPERLGRLWRSEPRLTGVGLLGLLLAAVTTAVAVWNGGWLLAPEGRLLEAVKFDVAISVFILTLGLILPLAPMTASGRRRWVAWTVGLILYAYFMENVQAWRGLDPRFSEVAGPVDRALGGIFLLQALGVLALFVILMRRFFRDDALPDHPALRLALRYGTAGALLAFGAGLFMSAIFGREFGDAGDLMPIHAAGFHALQAVPLVALLAGGAASRAADALRWTHVAGVGWLLFCAGLLLQALAGQPPLSATPLLGASLAGVLIWASALLVVLRARASRASALA